MELQAGSHGLLHRFCLSVFSPHLAVLKLLLPLPNIRPCSSPELPSAIFCSHPFQKRLTCHPPPSSPLFQHFSVFLYPLYSGYMLTLTHLPSSHFLPLCPLSSECIPSLYHPSVFAFLYLALSRLLFTMKPAFNPVCQPLTCILATTSPLALMLHAEQANKTPGEWRTSILTCPPPSIHPIIPSHVKMRPYFVKSGNKHLTLNAPISSHISINLWKPTGTQVSVKECIDTCCTDVFHAVCLRICMSWSPQLQSNRLESLNELQTETFNGAAVACWALPL